MPILVLLIHRHRLMQHIQQGHDDARVGREVEGVETLYVRDVGVGGVLEQKVEYVEMPDSSGPLERRRLEVAADGVDGGAMVDEPSGSE